MSSIPVVAVFTASILACIVTTFGIYIIGKHEAWGRKNVVYFMSFAAGVLITVSFVHLIPRSFEMNPLSPVYLLAGFFALYGLNRLITIMVCNEMDAPDLSFGLIPMLGIGFHSFLDGVIYSVTFNVSIFTGVLAAIGMVLHEFPEGIVTFLLLGKGGMPKRRASAFAFIAAAISTPIGTLLSFPFIQRIEKPTLGALLGLSSGALVYVGASHLLPAVEKENQRYTLVSLLSGILVAAIIVMSKGAR